MLKRKMDCYYTFNQDVSRTQMYGHTDAQLRYVKCHKKQFIGDSLNSQAEVSKSAGKRGNPKNRQRSKSRETTNSQTGH